MPTAQKTVCICSRPECNHIWLPASEVLPKRCAKCKSPAWNREPKSVSDNSQLSKSKKKPAPHSVPSEHPESIQRPKEETKKKLRAPVFERESVVAKNSTQARKCWHGFFVVGGITACPHKCKLPK